MSLLAWNCRGLGNPRIVRALKKLLKDKDPHLVFLSETRRKDHEMNVWRNLHGLANLITVSCHGEGKDRAGGLAFFWKEGVEVQLLSMSVNHIDLLVSMGESIDTWRCTCIYGFSGQSIKMENL